MAALLDRAALLSALALRTKDVTLASGAVVRVRTMTAGERIGLSSAAVGDDGKIDAKAYSARVVAASVIGEDGVRLFNDDDAQALIDGASDVFEELIDAAQSVNGMGSRAVEAAKGN